MNHFLFLLTIFLLFVIEGTVVQIFSPERWGLSMMIIPRFVVVMVIYSALYLGRIQGLFIGLTFGLLYDVVYGEVIGIHAFAMAIVGYFSGLTFKVFQQSYVIILATIFISLFVHEFIIYALLSLIDYIDMGLKFFFFKKVIPTTALNLIFALLIAYPVNMILTQLKKEEG